MAGDLELEMHDQPDPAFVRQIVQNLVAANDLVAPPENYQPLAAEARSEGRLIGGVAGYTHWGWLFVGHLWVADDERGGRVGSQLMEAIEGAARARGVESAHVDTYDFQALGFYQRNGYVVFGELDSYPVGHTRFFLQKRLPPDDRHA